MKVEFLREKRSAKNAVEELMIDMAEESFTDFSMGIDVVWSKEKSCFAIQVATQQPEKIPDEYKGVPLIKVSPR